LHATSTTPSEKIKIYQDEAPRLISISPYLGTYFYRFNVTRPPLDDPRVRMALSLAVDREAIIDSVTKGGQLPAYSFTPPNTKGYYPPKNSVSHDTRRARRLLAEAGFPGGKDFPELELLYNTSDGHRRIAEAIQQMWKKNLGLDITVKNIEGKVYWDTIVAGKVMFWRMGYAAEVPDSHSFLYEIAHTTNGEKNLRWERKDFDKLVEDAMTELDYDKRREMYFEAQEILHNEGGTTVVAFASFLHGVSDKLGHGAVGGFRRMDDSRLGRRWWFKS